MLTIKQINAKIGSIRKSTEAIRRNVHEVLCSAAGHAFEHGDVTSFTRLIDATKGANQKLIMAWVRKNGFAVWNEEKNAYVVNASARKEADFEDGTACAIHLFANVPAWYEAAPSASDIAKLLDPAARIEALAKQVEKADDIAINLRAMEDAIQHLAEAIKAKRAIKLALSA